MGGVELLDGVPLPDPKSLSDVAKQLLTVPEKSTK